MTVQADAQRHALELSLGSGREFTGLRGHVVRRHLLEYIPLEVAQRELVLPLRLDDHTLTVATARLFPDLRAVHARHPDLEVELVLARADEIALALQDLRKDR